MEAVAAGTGASIGVAALARRWFRRAVQDVVDERIGALEQRVAQHLNQQDARLIRIERALPRGRY